jgi:hypothetical protein
MSPIGRREIAANQTEIPIHREIAPREGGCAQILGETLQRRCNLSRKLRIAVSATFMDASARRQNSRPGLAEGGAIIDKAPAGSKGVG